MNDWIGIPDDITPYYGYIYIITNIKTGRSYVGKKFFRFKRTRKPLKGRKNKRHYLVESDWKSYYSSSNELLKDIKEYGESNFKREVLKLCKTPWECSYYELVEQIEREVLFREDSYNGIIQVRLPKAPKNLRIKNKQ